MLSKFILLAVVYSLCCNMGTPWVQVRQITKWQMKRIRGTDIELAAKYSGPSYSPAQWTAKSGDGDVDVDGDRDEIDKGLLLVQLFRVFRLFAVFVCCVMWQKLACCLAVWLFGCLVAWLGVGLDVRRPQDRNIWGKYVASAAVCFRPTLMAFEIMSALQLRSNWIVTVCTGAASGTSER